MHMEGRIEKDCRRGLDLALAGSGIVAVGRAPYTGLPVKATDRYTSRFGPGILIGPTIVENHGAHVLIERLHPPHVSNGGSSSHC